MGDEIIQTALDEIYNTNFSRKIKKYKTYYDLFMKSLNDSYDKLGNTLINMLDKSK